MFRPPQEAFELRGTTETPTFAEPNMYVCKIIRILFMFENVGGKEMVKVNAFV